MPTPPTPIEELQADVDAFVQFGSKTLAARFRGMPETTFTNRIRAAKRAGIEIPEIVKPASPGRKEIDLYDGVILAGSDAHYFPGEPSTAHKAFVRFCKRMRPKIVVVNGDALDAATISRHPPIGRNKGGLHAASNNALWAGRTMVTGHLHAQTVREITDYNGTRWGMDLGCMADIYGPQFAYMEDNPRNWRSGFGVITIREGRLLRPEPVTVVEPGLIEFRGELICVE